jgi:aminoglycoside phosphotransferase (APT) family kinase protein
MDLQPLFEQPILEQTVLDPGYSGHANDVWRVRTSTETVIVRSFRGEQPEGPFWHGCRRLFGIDPADLFALEPLNALLGELSPIPVPRVLRTGHIAGRRCLVVEHMQGEPLSDLRSRPRELLFGLGQALARIHARHVPYYGQPSGNVRAPLDSFHRHMVTVMRDLAAATGDAALEAALEPVCSAALALPRPASGSLVMVDLDPTQFLTDGRRITALVDTEAYVVGPRELDFIALEFVLDPPAAVALAAGYRSVAALPELRIVRPIYRFLYRLFEVQGEVELQAWMAWPVLFDDT